MCQNWTSKEKFLCKNISLGEKLLVLITSILTILPLHPWYEPTVCGTYWLLIIIVLKTLRNVEHGVIFHLV